MGLTLFVAAVAAFALILKRFVIYVVPAFFGIGAFLWAAQTGAGLGAIFVGGAAGVAIFLLGYCALRSRYAWHRWTVIPVYVLPSAMAGYYAAQDVGSLGLIPSPTWRHVLGVCAAIGFAAAAFKGLATPLEGRVFARRL